MNRKYKAGDKVLIMDRETLGNCFRHEGEDIIIYDNVRYFTITPAMRDRCCGEIDKITEAYYYGDDSSYYELECGYVLPEKMIVGKVNGKIITSLLNNETETGKGINEFCNKFCIMECNKICPLYKFKIRKDNEREITKNFKEGEKVKLVKEGDLKKLGYVRKYEEGGYYYQKELEDGQFYFITNSMLDLLGQEVTIAREYTLNPGVTFYYIEEDGEEVNWNEDLFKEIEE